MRTLILAGAVIVNCTLIADIEAGCRHKHRGCSSCCNSGPAMVGGYAYSVPAVTSFSAGHGLSGGYGSGYAGASWGAGMSGPGLGNIPAGDGWAHGSPHYYQPDVPQSGNPATGVGMGGDPYTEHFGYGFQRHSVVGHYRFPYYNYRAPWYYPGTPVFNRDTNYAW